LGVEDDVAGLAHGNGDKQLNRDDLYR